MQWKTMPQPMTPRCLVVVVVRTMCISEMFIHSTARVQLVMVTGRLESRLPASWSLPVTDADQKTHLRQCSDSGPVTVRYEGLVEVMS